MAHWRGNWLEGEQLTTRVCTFLFFTKTGKGDVYLCKQEEFLLSSFLLMTNYRNGKVLVISKGGMWGLPRYWDSPSYSAPSVIFIHSFLSSLLLGVMSVFSICPLLSHKHRCEQHGQVGVGQDIRQSPLREKVDIDSS